MQGFVRRIDRAGKPIAVINWVSSRQPWDIPAFICEMLALLAASKARGQQASSPC
jgi:hypothetical protein